MQLKTLLFGLCMALICCDLSRGANDKEIPSMERIREVWKARQARLETVVVTWKSTRTLLDADIVFEKRVVDTIRPTDYQSVEIPEITLALGSKPGQIRYENEDRDSRLDGVVHPSQSAFNGELATTYIAPRAEDKFGRGIRRRVYLDGAHLDMRAMVLACRPFNSFDDEFDLDHYIVGEQIENIRGHQCAKLIEEKGTRYPGFSTALYIDLDRDYVPVRMIGAVEDEVTSQFNIHYVRNSVQGWLPSSWEAAMFMARTGAVSESAKSTVTSIQINEPVNESRFVLDFPPGTRIVDVNDDGRTETTSVVDVDGAERPPTLSDWQPAKTRSTFWLLVGNGILLVVVAVLCIYVLVQRAKG